MASADQGLTQLCGTQADAAGPNDFFFAVCCDKDSEITPHARDFGMQGIRLCLEHGNLSDDL